MTNTKFRKRALLSSVAMLLVALVALGSATFAWFQANPNVKADGLSLETKASAGLAIATASVKGLFVDPVEAFDKTSVLKAVGDSSSYATDATAFTVLPAAPYETLASGALTFGTAPAALSSSKDLAENASWSSGDANVYSENIFLKTSTTDAGDTVDVASAGVAITLSGSNAARYGVKVALVAHQGAIAGVGNVGDANYVAPVAASDTLIGIWYATGGDQSKVWNGQTGTSGDVVDASAGLYVASGAPKAFSLKATTSTTDNYVTAYVYLDGENAGVLSDNVPNITALVSSIDIRFSTGTVSFS